MIDRVSNAAPLPPEIARRRTFAIISHPDAGKTTLTEKFLLYGGAIQMAGQVRAKGEARRTRSDFMQLERSRGISVSATAMSFDYRDFRFNLVDTPGHSDFSEDTYRTLTAVDAAVMVIDGARGVESQTRKLFEICRLRDLPILTFCNKMDQESRDTFETIDEIQECLAIDVTPASWPVGMGRDFIGSYDILNDRLDIMERADRNKVADSIEINGLDDPKLAEHVPDTLLGHFREEVAMARELLPPFDRQSFLDGALTPIWFGSAINSFGVKDLMNAVGDFGPPPQPQPAEPRLVAPDEEKVSGFVFKVQANMDPKHRDRVAFVRLASGHFQRGMKLHHVRAKASMSVSSPVLFLASERELAEEAWAGDIEDVQGHKVNYPMIGDHDLAVAKLYNMLPADESGTSEGRTPINNATVRSVFIIAPDKTIKLMLTYPMTTGRNFDEILRVLDSRQLTAKHKVATPVNWQQGEDVIIVPAVSNEEAEQLFPEGWTTVKPYLRTVKQPGG